MSDRLYSGFIPAAETKKVRADWPTIEGAEPFEATIRTDLSFREIDAIPFGNGFYYTDLFNAIGPYVIEWNAYGFNPETKEYEAIPPPAEGGPDSFRAVAPKVAMFLAVKLKTVHLGDPEEREQKKANTEPTPDGSDDPPQDSPAPVKSRKNRTTSNSSAGST